jgi:uncharacterized membrane protein
VLENNQHTYENEQTQAHESVADFFPTLHQREQSVAHPQHGTVQFRRQLEPGARATASATVRQMRTAQQETAPQLPEPSNPTPNFIDVNSDSESIVVNAPLSEVYHRCLRFEDFPAFINSISKMDRIDNTHFSCTSSINGEEVQSDVQIIMRVPDRRIAWRAASDHFRVGVVSFYPTGGGTKVTVKVRSIVEPVQLTGALRHCLRNFKVYIENDTQGKSAFATSPSPW